MATIIVNTFNEDNDSSNSLISLREAIALASSGDTIEFDPSLSGATVQLDSELTINKNLTIDGDADGDESTADIIIDAGGNSRVFTINNNSNSFIDIALANLTITGGSATDGGGIFNRERLTLTNSTVSGNTVTDDGGGIFNLGATLTIENSTISDNLSGDHGGGIYSDTFGNTLDSAVTLSNSTVSGNTASSTGGGIFHNIDLNNDSSTLTINNSTLTNNSAATGGGINNNDGVASLTSTIVAGNTGDDDLSGIFTSGGNNLIGNGNGSTGFTNGSNDDIVGTAASPVDAGLDALADNGGPTLTHNLQTSSPAINAGSNPDSLTTDQRGEDRVQGGTTDIGAYEGVAPDTLTVDNLSDEDDGDLSDGDLSLREALKHIADGGTIDFSNSLLNETISLTGEELVIDRSVTINGLGADQLTIDAQGNSCVFNVDDDNDSNVSTVTIDGLTITGGTALRGGGIYNKEELTISNSTASGNTSEAGGGGIYNDDGTLTISDSNLSDNWSYSGYGGGVSNSYGAVTISNSTLSGNTSAGGGAVYSIGALTISDSILSENRAVHGGGIYIGSYYYNTALSTAVIVNSTISNNRADRRGGGILNRTVGRVTVSDSTIRDNLAFSIGGGIANRRGGETTISNSTLSGNSSYTSGGGIANETNGILTITNSTLSSNTAARYGGGIYVIDTNTTTIVSNSTISGNSAGNSGGGVVDRGSNTTTITSTIIAGNEASSYGPDTFGSFSDGGNNLIGDATGSTSFTISTLVGDSTNSIDPALGELQDNGGLTETQALQSGSPAINTGSNPDNLTTDQRGEDRVQGGTTDIGAYESVAPDTLTVDNLSDEADGDVFDGDVSLRDALANIVDGGTITFSSDLAGGTITLDNTLGALSIANSSITIDGSNASQLSIDAQGNSRVLDIRYSSVLLNGITITGGSNSSAGGIFSFRSNLTIANSTLTGNTATTGLGGALVSQYGTVAIANSTIVSNSAARDGGGVFLLNTNQASLSNNTLTGNTASEDGGAIATFANGGTTTTLTNNLISGNRATGDGNEIFNAVGNSIFVNANNLLGDSDQTYDDAFEGVTPGAADIVATSDNSSSATYDPTALADILEVDGQGDPLLQDNGGLTETVALVVGSPAINAGDNTNIPADLGDQDGDGDTAEDTPFDQRGDGFDRVSGTSVDIGATELQVSIPTVTLSVSSTTASEADTTTLTVTVTTSEAVSGNQTVALDLSGTGITPDDFDGTLPDTLTISDGETTASVTVDIADDTVVEGEETASFAISNPSGGLTLGTTTTVDVVIADNDTQTVVVDTLVDEDDGDLSAGDISLREALAAVDPGGTITFANSLLTTDAGLGYGVIGLEGTQLTIAQSVTIDGDINGDGTGDITLDAQGNSRVLNINDGNNGNTIEVSLSGLTITGGRVSNNGGGIFNRESLAIANSTISGNSAGRGGGGIYNYLSTSAIANSTISGNSAGRGGGGIYNYLSTSAIVNSTISGNSASRSGGGGGINNYGGTSAIVNSTISGNSAGFGGGISNDGSISSIANSTISGNSAGRNGGGIFDTGTLATTNSTIIANSTISGNSASNGGGGIFNYVGTSAIVNSTISGNSASNGGGLFNAIGTSSIANSIVSGNTATNSNEIYNDSIINANANNLLGDSSQTNSEAFAGFTPDVSSTSDIIATSDNSSDDGGVALSDILNSTLTDNGDSTLTLALVDGSPAIDAGNDNNIPADLGDQDGDGDTAEDTPFDQRGDGFDRVIGTSVDIGAFERQNIAPTITSAATANAAENQTVAIDVAATDDADTEGAGLTYSITDGADAALFSIDADTGEVTFDSAPDFENPGDEGADNVYNLQVTVTDSSGLTDVQDIAITVTDVDENTAPIITSAATAEAAENQTVAIDVETTDDADAEGTGLTYSITDGADAALFSIDADTGEVTFDAAPDFENPGDAGGDNVYDLQVTVTDSSGLTDVQDIAITVTDVDENTAPIITSAATAEAAENQTVAIDVETTDDADTEGNGLTYSITDGADAALFSIDADTGEVTFDAAPDFETPGDDDGDNVYDLQVTVTDSSGLTDVQDIAITVTDVDENNAPTITSAATVNAAENQTVAIDVEATDDADTEGAGLTYSITDGDDADLFSIDADTGEVTFDAAPDFETPGDAGGDNVYDLQVTVTDSGGLTDVQDIAITVTDVDETSSNGFLFSLENNTNLGGVTYTDQDILQFNGTDTSLFFDGSDVLPQGAEISAFDVISDTEILLSFDRPLSLPNVGRVDDSDIVKFTATSLGSNTAGSFSSYFDGSDVGLSAGSEDIDALVGLPDGSLLLSTTGNVNVPGVSRRDEDILLFTPTSLGSNTAGSFSVFFDGSDVGLGRGSEDIDAFSIDAAGDLFFSTTGNFSVPGLSGEDEDIFGYTPSSTGTVTRGDFASDLFFEGDQDGGFNTDIKGIDLTFTQI